MRTVGAGRLGVVRRYSSICSRYNSNTCFTDSTQAEGGGYRPPPAGGVLTGSHTDSSQSSASVRCRQGNDASPRHRSLPETLRQVGPRHAEHAAARIAAVNRGLSMAMRSCRISQFSLSRWSVEMPLSTALSIPSEKLSGGYEAFAHR